MRPTRRFIGRATSTVQSRWSHPASPSSLSACSSRLPFPSTSTRQYSSSEPSRGLFSIPDLKQPSDFVRLASAAMTECDSLRALISAKSKEPCDSVAQASETLFLLDRISQHVCNVIDAAELARSVHASEAWRESAHRAFVVLSDYIAQLNADPVLYEALVQVTQSGSIVSQLTEEEQRFVVLLKAEFERDGIHLPDAQRERIRQLQGTLTELETLFSRNLVHSKKEFLADAELVQAVIPEHVLDTFGITLAEPGKLQLSSEPPQILQTLLKYSSSPQLRREVYMESMTAVPENLAVLDRLVDVRHDLATALGYDSYADRFLRDKMARNPETVLSFLDHLRNKTHAEYRREMELLSSAKQRIEQSPTVEPWDVSFYVGLVKASDGFDVNEVSPYMTLQNCVSGMQLLCEKLFGITMKETDMTSDEQWDVNENSAAAAPPEGMRVRRFEFVDETGRPLGTMYLDLYPREGKYGHAAHFTVRCGCLPTLDESAEYQLPIVALVCNLSASSATSMLAHAEVETLFHEFGHALHSLLGRTRFQHMSGTRAAMDFVETPSHLIEKFVWDTDFLRSTAFHHQTGQVIPDAIIEGLQKSEKQFVEVERRSQIIYADFDQKLFGGPSASGSSTMDLFAKLHRENGVPYAEGTHWYSRFGHLVTYGAGYYGYLYAQEFANDIWEHCFQGNSLSRPSGDKLWHSMLVHGGAKDPDAMLNDILDRSNEQRKSVLLK